MLTKPDRGMTVIQLIASYYHLQMLPYALLQMMDKQQEPVNKDTDEVETDQSTRMITEDPAEPYKPYAKVEQDDFRSHSCPESALLLRRRIQLGVY